MSIESIRQYIKEKAAQFGAKPDVEYNKPYIERNNTNAEALRDNGGYFGFIHPEEDPSGPFHDFSLTIFPCADDKAWLVCLGIGSSGFKNDYELATYPGLRRLFSKLIDENGFCKSDFADIETGLPKLITQHPQLQHLKSTIKIYTKVLPVCQIVEDPSSDSGKEVIAAFVAAYAKLRDWPTNREHRSAITVALAPFIKKQKFDQSKEVESLLLERKYVVLQGPPGIGKTRMTKILANEINAKTFFTQFHAETSYSDFIFGIRPDIDSENLRYQQSLGVFVEALLYAQQHQNEKVLLIIDEMNRANLSNVLGPIFYLFEHKMDLANVEIEITPALKLNQLPPNFYVLATMNTADRSLAVVDFALRRRFAWYSLKPMLIEDRNFKSDDFMKIQEIFDWYATSNELSLQPGQGYFLAESDEEMQNRIKYEIFPLIKEYLQEGLLRSATEEFNTYFMNRIQQSLFE